MRAGGIAVLAALGAAAGATSAEAATLTFGPSGRPGQCCGTMLGAFYTAEPGEANAATIRKDNQNNFIITDLGATRIRYQPGKYGATCVGGTFGVKVIVCRVVNGPPTVVNADLGDGADTLTVQGNFMSTLRGGPGADVITSPAGEISLVYGGPGNDTLNGSAAAGGAVPVTRLEGDDGDDTLLGKGRTLLVGGAGADSMGGTGEPVVEYFDRTAPLTVSLDGLANDGEAGEGDNVSPDVTRVDGGSGNDVLIGGPGPDHLVGWNGDDVIDGRAGDDLLTGVAGSNDVTGGPGRDRVGGAGTDTLRVADGEADQLFCLGGTQTVFADPLDGPLSGCEIVNL